LGRGGFRNATRPPSFPFPAPFPVEIREIKGEGALAPPFPLPFPAALRSRVPQGRGAPLRRAAAALPKAFSWSLFENPAKLCRVCVSRTGSSHESDHFPALLDGTNRPLGSLLVLHVARFHFLYQVFLF